MVAENCCTGRFGIESVEQPWSSAFLGDAGWPVILTTDQRHPGFSAARVQRSPHRVRLSSAKTSIAFDKQVHGNHLRQPAPPAPRCDSASGGKVGDELHGLSGPLFLPMILRQVGLRVLMEVGENPPRPPSPRLLSSRRGGWKMSEEPKAGRGRLATSWLDFTSRQGGLALGFLGAGDRRMVGPTGRSAALPKRVLDLRGWDVGGEWLVWRRCGP